MIGGLEAIGFSAASVLVLIGAMVLLGYRLLPRDEERTLAEAKARIREKAYAAANDR